MERSWLSDSQITYTRLHFITYTLPLRVNQPANNQKLYNIRNRHLFGKGVKDRMFGTQDLIIIAVIVIVLFGSTKLPQIGSGIGQAIRNFKKGISEADEIEAPKKDSSEKEETKKKEDK